MLGLVAVFFELQEVLAVLGFFVCEGGEVEADVDCEAAPAGFGDLEGGVFADCGESAINQLCTGLWGGVWVLPRSGFS